MSYDEKVTAFLCSYIVIPKHCFLRPGVLLKHRVIEFIGYLLERGVFDTFEELQLEALNKQGIILNFYYFLNDRKIK